VLQFDKHDIEALKLVKLDLLGLGILTAVTDALDLIARDVGARPDLDALPEEIAEVWRAVGAADTIGVFQIESRAQQQSLPRTKPVKMDDLVAQVAIIRPGQSKGMRCIRICVAARGLRRLPIHTRPSRRSWMRRSV
jgi:error-prone DNA polymerase